MAAHNEVGPSVAKPDFEWLDIDLLQFDPDNPRFLSNVKGNDIASVLRFMIDDASLIELIRSIASQGFFPGEPILVAASTDGEGKWTVIEGNRRLAATKLINDPSLADVRAEAVKAAADLAVGKDLTRLPCLIFPTRDSIMEYLGYRHVTGIKEWSPLAKARYLRERYERHAGPEEEALRSVARSIGSRSDYVARLLTAHQIFERLTDKNFFGIRDLGESTINFSLITSVLAYSNIVEFLGLDSSRDFRMPNLIEANLEFLVRFVFEKAEGGKTRLRESRNIGRLSDVLANENARSALREGAPLAQAAQLLGSDADAFRTLLLASIESLRLAVRQADGLELREQDEELIAQVWGAARDLSALLAPSAS